MGREGTVVLRVAINEKGNLTDVDVVQSGGYGFDEEAVRAIRDSTFKPAIRNGRPTACLAELPVRFVFRSEEND
jgi:protein TonB